MRRIEAFQTADGQTFPDKRAACQHAQNRYDEAMTALRLRLQKDRPDIFGIREAMAVCIFIEQNFAEIARLATLDADMHLEPDDDE